MKMKMVKTACKVWMASLVLLVAAVLFWTPACAEGEGTHTVSGSYKEQLPGDMDYEGITFKLFKVGHLDGATLVLDISVPTDVTQPDLSIQRSDYPDTDEGTQAWTKDWLAQAKIVADYLPEEAESAGGEAKTDADGKFTFPNAVPDGLYLLTSTDDPRIAASGDTKAAWSPQPMLVLVDGKDVTVTVKPTSTPLVDDYSVVKIWDDKDYESDRPESIDVEIYYNYKQGGQNTPIETVTLNADNDWCYSWSTSDGKYKDKNNGTYTVKEVITDEIKKKYSIEIKENASAQADAATFNIINSYREKPKPKPEPDEPEKTPKKTTPPAKTVKTGDQSSYVTYYVLAALAVIALILLLISRIMSRKKDDADRQ